MKAGDTTPTVTCTVYLKILSEFIQTNFAFGSVILTVEKHSRTLQGFRRDFKVFTRMDGGLPRLFKDSTQTSRTFQDCANPVRIRRPRKICCFLVSTA